MDRIEAEKTLADAVILERAARVLDRTSHREPFHFTAAHWLGVMDTLREVAAAKRKEVDDFALSWREAERRHASQEG